MRGSFILLGQTTTQNVRDEYEAQIRQCIEDRGLRCLRIDDLTNRDHLIRLLELSSNNHTTVLIMDSLHNAVARELLFLSCVPIEQLEQHPDLPFIVCYRGTTATLAPGTSMLSLRRHLVDHNELCCICNRDPMQPMRCVTCGHVTCRRCYDKRKVKGSTKCVLCQSN